MSEAKCPICGKPADAATKPFCSKRCADVDLQRWLSGRYAIPAVEADEGPDEDGEED
ncbi:MAG: gyrase inhibitor YacG [Phenylobacterium sp.]|jgi:endogenous inhibitor of DNA gyrase (YacG/DUF329 family)|nr:gyrase inhibitor YacG [Phenylobacterium sp.]